MVYFKQFITLVVITDLNQFHNSMYFNDWIFFFLPEITPINSGKVSPYKKGIFHYWVELLDYLYSIFILFFQYFYKIIWIAFTFRVWA